MKKPEVGQIWRWNSSAAQLADPHWGLYLIVSKTGHIKDDIELEILDGDDSDSIGRRFSWDSSWMKNDAAWSLIEDKKEVIEI